MHLVFVFIVLVILSVVAWVLWDAFVFLMTISITISVTLFGAWALLECLTRIWKKQDAERMPLIAIALGLSIFAVWRYCETLPVIIGTVLGFSWMVWSIFQPEKPIQPHELEN